MANELVKKAEALVQSNDRMWRFVRESQDNPNIMASSIGTVKYLAAGAVYLWRSCEFIGEVVGKHDREFPVATYGNNMLKIARGVIASAPQDINQQVPDLNTTLQT